MPKANKRFISLQPSESFIWIFFTLSIAISQSVAGNSTELLMENVERTELLELEDFVPEKEEIHDRQKEALEDLEKIFGIRVQSANNYVRHKAPPQFMMELYNTIADPSGITRGKSPYNAKIVRSFVERDTRLPQIYLFNISGLEGNESVIGAELHLFRKRSALEDINPKIRSSPYYLIRVYQVLEGQSMDEPDVHRLLTVHYVSAYASGWQVFNVKQAVLAWMAGAPNLGLMVKTLTFFGDEASIEFTRRNDYPSKQPILVLFDDDGRVREDTADKIHGEPHYYTYNDDQEEDELVENDASNDNNDRSNFKEEKEKIDSKLVDDYQGGSTVHRRKRQQDESEFQVNTKTNSAVVENKELNAEIDYGTQLGNNLETGKTEFFQRYKRIGRKQDFRGHRDFSTGSAYFQQYNYRPTKAREGENIEKTLEQLMGNFDRHIRSAKPVHSQLTMNPPDRSEFVTQKKTRGQRVLSSMDIYERELLREQFKKKSHKIVRENNKGKTEKSKQESLNNYKRKQRKRFPREVESGKGLFKRYVDLGEADSTECMRHELYVDFQDIGLSNSIIAPKGYSAFRCQGRCETLATHDQLTTNHASLRGVMYKMGLVKDFYLPCCVPTKLSTISILYFDDSENVVLKMYEDMIADRCGCR